MIYNQTAEYTSDVQRLSQRVPTLVDDIERVRPKLAILCTGQGAPGAASFCRQFFNGKKAIILQQTEHHTVVKLRLDTDTDAYRQALRLICAVEWRAVDGKPGVHQARCIQLIELYSVYDKRSEDERRIRRALQHYRNEFKQVSSVQSEEA